MSTSRQRQQAIVICVCLAVLITAVYWPVGHAGFLTYDDAEYVTANPHVQGGLTIRDVMWAFTACHSGNWHPLTWLSHALDCECFGMNAGGHHATSVLLHVVNTVLLFLVLRRMTGATWRSAWVAALFGVHPLHVESVAWVAERKDVLSGLFWMLAMWGYVRYVEQPTRGRYAMVVGWYAMGLMAKPMVVTLPFVLLLLDYWPLGRTRWRRSVVGNNVPLRFGELVREKLLFFALAAVSCGVTIWAQHSAGAINSLERLSLGARMANAVVSYVRYMEKAVWPSGLAVFYPFRVWRPAAVIVAGAILAAVSCTVIRRALRQPHLAVGWFWFLGTLVPAIGLVQVGGQSMADRYTYLPLIGLFIMLCWSVPSRAMERWDLKVITCDAAAVVLAVCAALSRGQVEYWKDSETLFRHALDVTRDNWAAHDGLGVALEQSGKIEEAIAHYEQALRINPDLAEAHNNLGIALAQAGRMPEAIEHLEHVLRIESDYAEAHNNLGIALAQVGRMPEAIEHLEHALRIKPDDAKAHFNLGKALAQMDRVPEAIVQYEQALQITPDDAMAHNNLGIALAQTSKIEEAIAHFEQALRIKPDYAEAHFNLGNTLARRDRMPEAIVQYEQALRIKPDYAQAQNALARLQGRQ
jgi:tetratricopeptide (TPR) repeat protein